MKRFRPLLALPLGALLLMGSAPALSFELSGGSTAFTSEYVFRGVSQTDEKAAVQGGLDFDLGGGAYFSLWASNVDFTDGANEVVSVASAATPHTSYSGPSLELDIVLGYSFELGEGLAADIGVIRYEYPGDEDDESYEEFYFSVSQDLGEAGSWTAGVNYSDDYFGGNEAYFYVYGGYTRALTEQASLSLHVGWNSFDSEEDFDSFFDSADDSEDAYIDWSVTVSQTFFDVDFALTYHDTDIDSDICEDWCEERVVFTMSKSF